MAFVYLTIDTEYEAGFTARNGRDTRAENFKRSILCDTPDGAVGIFWQMEMLDRHGLKAVFFVDPMPALVWGTAAIADVVGPIVERGHDVQLHIHTEWLQIAGHGNPLGERIGTNIKDFSFEEQCTLLRYARDTLVAAGAPPPTAFRAGNYGANDDTLRGLAELGLTHDTSHSPGFPHSACEIGLGREDVLPLHHAGVIEVPVGCIGDLRGRRHAQLTAVSFGELSAAIRHAQSQSIASFTLVSHSFELLSRDRKRINAIVKRRFERLCAFIAGDPNLKMATFRHDPPQPLDQGLVMPVLPANPMRTAWRMAEQAVVNALYGGR